MTWQKRPDRMKRHKKSKPVIFQLRTIADEFEERQKKEAQEKIEKDKRRNNE